MSTMRDPISANAKGNSKYKKRKFAVSTTSQNHSDILLAAPIIKITTTWIGFKIHRRRDVIFMCTFESHKNWLP